MIAELERIWKVAVVACFNLLSWRLPRGTEENCETSVRIAGLQFEI
jgi:hypothetical protein